MTARRYRIDGDPRRALASATAQGWAAAAPGIVIGSPACLLRFETAADQVIFRLACPADWPPIESFGLDLVPPIDPPFARAAFAPILNQMALADRVRLCDLVYVDLPTHTDHDRLLARLRACGWHADIY